MWNPLEVMGRRGDTLIAHITPREAAILKALGGSGTMNPKTGYWEFWSDSGDGGVGGSESGMGTGGDDSDGTGGADTSGGGLDAMGTTDATAAAAAAAAAAGLGSEMGAADASFGGTTDSFGSGLGAEMGAPGAFEGYSYDPGTPTAPSEEFGMQENPQAMWASSRLANEMANLGLSRGLENYAEKGVAAFQNDPMGFISNAITPSWSTAMGLLGSFLGMMSPVPGGAIIGNMGGRELGSYMSQHEMTAPSMEDVASLTGTNTPGSGDASYAGLGSIGTASPSIGSGFASMSTPMASGQQGRSALDKRPFWASVAERGGGGGTLARLLP